MATRVGLVGVGRWGRKILKTLANLEDVAVAGVTIRSKSGEAAELLPEGCRVFRDWQSLLDEALDGICVAVAPQFHAEIAQAALRAGVPVFVEKPIALVEAEAEAVEETARSTAGIIHVDHIDLFNPAWRALASRAAAWRDIRSMRGAIGERRPDRDMAPQWEYGPHVVACSLELLKRDPEAAELSALPAERGVGPAGSLLELRLAFGSATASFRLGGGMAGKTRRIEVAGDETLVYDDLARDRLKHIDAEGVATPVSFYCDTAPLVAALGRFVASVRSGAPDWQDAVLARRVVAVIARASRTAA